jgi:hypothetical protein
VFGSAVSWQANGAFGLLAQSFVLVISKPEGLIVFTFISFFREGVQIYVLFSVLGMWITVILTRV